MSKARGFHGLINNLYHKLGYWKTIDKKYEHQHTATLSRRLFYRFKTHVHPYAERLVTELVARDIDGLEALDTKDKGLRKTFFDENYQPVKIVAELETDALGKEAVGLYSPIQTGKDPLPQEGRPVDELDFDYAEGAYAVYNWEVFFHVPFTLAVNLSKNGRYAEAQRWFHYIFDPTDNSDPGLGPKRFWKVKPFLLDEIEHIQDTLNHLAATEGTSSAKRDSIVRAIGAWRSNPLRPHLVARTRPTAYMYATIMAYLDNLIAWGDSLFQQDTRESINEAMQFYVTAANILGPRPQAVPNRGKSKKQSYASLKANLDEFGNAAVKIEAEIGFDLFPLPTQEEGPKPEQSVLIESIGKGLYFCIPRNEKFIGYWDTVADRLFKIRNSLNLQGVFRQLPLFAPPIDPAMLARATAAGLDIGAIIAGTAAPLAPVRFQSLLQRAIELCQEVKSLGGQILAAIEKKDNETLGVLRAKHEKTLLDLAGEIRQAQWKETIKNREGIERNIENAFQRYRYYERLLGRPDTEIKKTDWQKFDPTVQIDEQTNSFGSEPEISARAINVQFKSSWYDGGHAINPEEARELDLLQATQVTHDIANTLDSIGAFLALIPDFALKAMPFGLGADARFGGTNLDALMKGLSSVARGIGSRLSYEGGQAAKMANFTRREQDWAFQANSAVGELNQLYKQLRAAEIREHIAKKELDNHAKQLSQSEEINEFLTNEKNLRAGKDRKTSTEDFYLWMKGEAQTLHSQYFQFAYETAKKAERALQREFGDPSKNFIQSSYLTGREGLFAGERLYLDLKRMDLAYAELNQREYEITKYISLREWFPVQLMEIRQKGACAISIPEALFDLDCPGHIFRRIKSVAISIPCVAGPYASVNCSLTLQNSDVCVKPNEYTQYRAAMESIVTSSAQNDSGMFEPNLRDERPLPFEGAGAISTWGLTLLGTPRAFDYDTIADVVLTIRYTARGGGDLLKARERGKTWLQENSARLFSIRHEFSPAWANYKRASNDKVLKFTLTKEHYPYLLQNVTGTSASTSIPNAARMHLFFKEKAEGNIEITKDGKPIENTKFDPVGPFEINLGSIELEDLWIVVDWAKA